MKRTAINRCAKLRLCF